MKKCTAFNRENCHAACQASFCFNTLKTLPAAARPDRLKTGSVVRQYIRLDKMESFMLRTGVNLYVVNNGLLKTHVTLLDGHEWVQHFFLPGEIIGFDSMHSAPYQSRVTAIKPSILCEIPFSNMLEAIKEHSGLQEQLLLNISRQMATGYYVRHLNTEAKLSGFLLEYAQKVGSVSFRLPLSRTDIGAYLGLTTETVARCFTRLREQGLIEASGKAVKLLDVHSLKQKTM